MLDLNRIYCGDSLELMKSIPDKSIDLVLTDPPYGIGESNERNLTRGCLAVNTNHGNYEWDKKRISDISDVLRVSKNQIIFGGNYYTDFLTPSSCWIVWDKDNGATDFADCELAWTSFKTAVRKFKWKWQGMLQEDMSEKEIHYHPTQKPLALMKWILDKYSKPDDIILDPFCGSGTTCLAAEMLGRKWIGIDISRKYYQIAEKRIALYKSQGKLDL